MRRLDHARITELGDSIVKLERGPNLTVRGHRDVGGAHRVFHQRLVAEEERVVGQLPGNSSPGTDFSRAQEICFGKHDDALQAVAGDHLIGDQRDQVVGRVVRELHQGGQPGRVNVHGPRRDEDRSDGNERGEPLRDRSD